MYGSEYRGGNPKPAKEVKKGILEEMVFKLSPRGWVGGSKAKKVEKAFQSQETSCVTIIEVKESMAYLINCN